MADQLYLSYWLRGYTPMNRTRHYERMLRAFPYSKLSQGVSTLRVLAVSPHEPALLERAFDDPLELAEVLPILDDYKVPDTAFVLDTRWDLWQFTDDWSLQPARVSLQCFGTEFESDSGENLRIELGLDELFLPQPELPGSLRLTQANIKSLLHLVHDVDNALPVEKRQLWSETGENFADQLQSVLSGSAAR